MEDEITRVPVDWDAQPLGEKSDEDLAAELGVSRQRVSQVRRSRGIACYVRPEPEPVALLAPGEDGIVRAPMSAPPGLALLSYLAGLQPLDVLPDAERALETTKLSRVVYASARDCPSDLMVGVRDGERIAGPADLELLERARGAVGSPRKHEGETYGKDWRGKVSELIRRADLGRVLGVGATPVQALRAGILHAAEAPDSYGVDAAVAERLGMLPATWGNHLRMGRSDYTEDLAIDRWFSLLYFPTHPVRPGEDRAGAWVVAPNTERVAKRKRKGSR